MSGARDIIDKMNNTLDANEDVLTAWYVKTTGHPDRLGAWKARAKEAEQQIAVLSAGLREAVGTLYTCRYSEVPLAKKLDALLKTIDGESYYERLQRDFMSRALSQQEHSNG